MSIPQTKCGQEAGLLIQCKGTEKALMQCNKFHVSNCSCYEMANVVCPGLFYKICIWLIIIRFFL